MQQSINAEGLINFRTNNNITQREVANYLGVSVNTVSRWEIGKFKSIKLSDLISLLEFYKRHGLTDDDYTETSPTTKTRK